MRRLVLATLISSLVLALAFVPKVFAGSWVDVVGEVEITVYKEHGDLATGGEALGIGQAGYEAGGPHQAAGEANARGFVVGGNYQGANFAISGNLVGVKSDAETCALLGESTVGGFAGQPNWATAQDDGVIATGGNYTDGEYEGTSTGLCHTEAEGEALAGGLTVVSIDPYGNYREAHAWTGGFSGAGQSTGDGNASVYGDGGIFVGSSIANNGAIGVASGEAGATYNASGPNAAWGCLTAKGNATAQTIPGGVKVSVGVSSKAKAGSD